MFWIRYSRFMAGLFLLATVLAVVRHAAVLGIWDAVDWLVGLTSLVGLLAYVHGRRVLSPVFWAVFVPASLVWTAAYEVRLGNPALIHGSFGQRVPETLIASIFIFPLYLALFRYAYRSGRPSPMPKAHVV